MKKANPTTPKKAVVKQTLLRKELYVGATPSIIGKRRLLVRADFKESFVYVEDDPAAIEAVKNRYGKNFIRVLPIVQSDPRPKK